MKIGNISFKDVLIEFFLNIFFVSIVIMYGILLLMIPEFSSFILIVATIIKFVIILFSDKEERNDKEYKFLLKSLMIVQLISLSFLLYHIYL